jgi:nitroreductase
MVVLPYTIKFKLYFDRLANKFKDLCLKNLTLENINKLLIISQTTYSLEKFNEIEKRVKSKLPKNIELILKNTICKATELRQNETEKISKMPPPTNLMVIWLDFEEGNIRRNSPKERQEKRIRDRKLYYGKLMPFIYARFFGLLGLFRVILARTISLFRPMMLEVSECDMRVTVNKSCALAAQTFMIAMANEGYDTCPLEGFDSRRMKKLLKLPHGAGINMVIPCGIRDGNKGIWGERGRVPFDEIYHRI